MQYYQKYFSFLIKRPALVLFIFYGIFWQQTKNWNKIFIIS